MKQQRFSQSFPQVILLVLILGLVFYSPHLFAQDSSTVELNKIKKLFKKSDPIIWLFTGNSITHGNFMTHGYRSYSELFAERVRSEMARFRDIVINTGIAGDVVPRLTKDLEHRVLQFKPTVVSIMMGMNDTGAGPEGREAFRTAYNKLVDRLKDETDALIILHTPNPITAVATSRSDLPAYAQIILEVAQDRGVALCDQNKLWQEHLARNETKLIYLLGDGTIHPNRYGHVLFTHNLCKTLGIYDPNSNIGRFYLPR